MLGLPLCILRREDFEPALDHELIRARCAREQSVALIELQLLVVLAVVLGELAFSEEEPATLRALRSRALT